MPSKTPFAAPAGAPGRLPFSHMSRQDFTCAARLAGVSAASEKYFEPVQPPSEMLTRSFGNFFFNCLSWFRLPASA